MGTDYWQELLDLIQKMARAGMIGPHDLDLIYATDSVAAAINHIREKAIAPFDLKRAVHRPPLAGRTGVIELPTAALDRFLADLPRANAHRLLDLDEKQPSVADLPGACGVDDDRAGLVHERIPDHDLEFTLGQESDRVSAPAINFGAPFYLPQPHTSLTVMPSTPSAVSASRTSSSLNGLMIASIIFMRVSSLGFHDVAFFAVRADIEPARLHPRGTPKVSERRRVVIARRDPKNKKFAAGRVANVKTRSLGAAVRRGDGERPAREEAGDTPAATGSRS